MAYLPRGISPDILFSQVKSTMPYLVNSIEDGSFKSFAPAINLQEFESTLKATEVQLTHFDYFELCLSSHYLTCGTPVPTDVDNQIRKKLWPAQLPLEIALEMAQLVLESRKWDFTKVSSRFIYGAPTTPWEKEPLTGHLGEWFTVSAAAYCALAQYADPLAQKKRDELLDTISDEIHRHSEIFGSLWRVQDGLSCLKASAIIAHNFGDLDRVLDMWDLNIGDPLRLHFYKLATLPFDSNSRLRYLGRLWVAGELYKSAIADSSMALENHRHFALRKPKCLRENSELLVPMGPFFDDWGKTVARHLMTPGSRAPSENTLEVVNALKHGWERLPKTVGYGRALRGIMEIHPDLQSDISPVFQNLTPSLALSQSQFEKLWNDLALKEMEEIPSRA